MLTFKSSDLTHKRSEVMKAARDGAALIQLRETNGEVREEFVLMSVDAIKKLDAGDIAWYINDGNHLVKG